MKKQVRVVAAVIRRGDAILVQRRPPGHARALLWELPGGKVEPNETDAHALVRECMEELSVSVTVGSHRWSTVHEYDDLKVELVVYDVLLPPGAEPEPHDAYVLSWVRSFDLGRLPFSPADAPFIAELSRGS